MLRKSVFASAIFALSLFVLPFTQSAQAVQIEPNDVISPVAQNTTYAFTELHAGPAGAFVDNYYFNYAPTIISTASAVDLKLTSVVGFTTLTLSWIGPTSVSQTFDVLLNPNVAFNLDLSDGPGLYTLRINGTPTATAAETAYAGALTTGENANETPIPGAVLLFGSVLAGGVGLMRRRRSVAQAA
jgi:hypothetical protein